MKLTSVLVTALIAVLASAGTVLAEQALTPEADAATVQERLDQLDTLHVTNRREAEEVSELSEALEAILEEAEQAEKGSAEE